MGEEARNITHSKRPNEASGRVSTRRGKQVELDRDWEKRLATGIAVAQVPTCLFDIRLGHCVPWSLSIFV